MSNDSLVPVDVLRNTTLAYEHVARLVVAMHESARVNRGKPIEHLEDERCPSSCLHEDRIACRAASSAPLG